MKCSHCDNDAVYFYSENINGDVTETHLCEACAEREGLRERIDRLSGQFRLPRGLAFGDFAGAFGRDNARIPDGLLTGFFGAPPEPETRQSSSTLVSEPPQFDDMMAHRREVNVLRASLNNAVFREDFEEAAKLRDQIKAIDGN
ncbi:MAG: UvrB/UvrC motif-containing protein [Oscillospiraceae bacterium]|jgi:protein-arginine kinase activator protein McsA|nr:UvrB/UvrC motif-containing protein [Oscillospiraceae bacterium]